MKPKEGWERLSRLLSPRVPKSEQNVNSKCIFSQFLFLWNVNLALSWARQLKIKFQDSFRLISSRATFQLFWSIKISYKSSCGSPSKAVLPGCWILDHLLPNLPETTIHNPNLQHENFSVFHSSRPCPSFSASTFSWIIMYLWIW